MAGILSVRSSETTNNQTTHSSRHNHNSGSGGGGREDCWSESGTETLIESWGDRYLQLNRGNLRQKDWKDVALAVNANRDGSKAPRTDVQCKNRIDTLKKKYKLEKSKATPSKWPFFHRLDGLIGAANSVTRKKVSTPKSASVVTLTVKGNTNTSANAKPSFVNPNPNLKAVVYSGGSSRDEDGSVGRMESLDIGEETTAYKELARAIGRFGEVYERMESSKQEEMMKLEKQRMEFTRELEFQRLNMFMETQLELEKMKMMKNKKKHSSAKVSSSPGKTTGHKISCYHHIEAQFPHKNDVFVLGVTLHFLVTKVAKETPINIIMDFCWLKFYFDGWMMTLKFKIKQLLISHHHISPAHIARYVLEITVKDCKAKVKSYSNLYK
ncbi:hypothetical protein OSB04_025343 [Centaurea solstitialis]|uniref:Myb/SANT-like DNA-binding domain-containing protein n=1 Tax=Centaurea solstitialis TaxID=347529 RepID=A0AA38SZJ0_9ASTR|nr:hypothetical protein OSB04_025343 [Centaurea solstitialis]